MIMHEGRENGFSLVEMLGVVVFVTLICGSIFLLLGAAQQRFQMESQVLDSFQSARLAIDQISRDIHGAGFPPPNSVWSSVATANPQLVALPFAWDPNYPATPCTVGVNCNTPSQFDMIIEGNISPTTGAGVQWIRYQLVGTTLSRGVAPKTAGTSPAVATSAAGVMLPYVENVMNNATAAQMAAINISYPGTFPGNNPIPVFTYECNDSSIPPIPQPCTNAAVIAPNNTAPYIRLVGINLFVQAAQPDPKTGQPRIASLHTQAIVLNPNQ